MKDFTPYIGKTCRVWFAPHTVSGVITGVSPGNWLNMTILDDLLRGEVIEIRCEVINAISVMRGKT